MAGNVKELDFVCKNDMVAKLNGLVSAVQSGEVIGFAAVGVMRGGDLAHCHSFFPSQQLGIIGALRVKMDMLSSEYGSDDESVETD